ncbi:SMI1/KNR4 family protein [Vreelandella sp. GE22]
MLTEMNGMGKELSQKALEEAESELGYVFSEPYRKFLLKYNGGEPTESCIDFNGEKLKLLGDMVNVFYGLDVKPCDDIIHKMKLIGYQLPEGLIFIADTSGGNYFLLSLRDDSYGEVFYKDHEFEDSSSFDPKNKILPESIVKVSNNFDDFLACLYDGDE